MKFRREDGGGSDNLTAEQRQHTMRSVKSENTGPEMVVRKLAHAMGYRFRLHRKDLPGRPDLVFPGRRKVVFVHGCFWHGHDCQSGMNRPKANREYWREKLEGNMQRDLRNQDLLRESGWGVLVLWECELGDIDGTRERLRAFLG